MVYGTCPVPLPLPPPPTCAELVLLLPTQAKLLVLAYNFVLPSKDKAFKSLSSSNVNKPCCTYLEHTPHACQIKNKIYLQSCNSFRCSHLILVIESLHKHMKTNPCCCLKNVTLSNLASVPL